jgi:hypothetical protein
LDFVFWRTSPQRATEKNKIHQGPDYGSRYFWPFINRPGKRPIFYDSTLREILVKHLSSKARWLEKRFNTSFQGVKTILFFDEPSLSSYGSAFSSLNREEVIHSLKECFHAVEGLKGVHCCGNTDWSLLLETGLDILSFDAYGFWIPFPFIQRS